MIPELKNCPFCGGKATYFSCAEGTHAIRCNDCDVYMYSKLFQEIVDRWNSRTCCPSYESKEK